MNNWSIKSLQDLSLDNEEWDKKHIYATDADKCLSGVYHALLGAKPDGPIPAKNLRRMEVGKMVEENLVKKLKSQGIFLGGQDRIFDEKFNVSGRPDGIIISPEACTDEAKVKIRRKTAIFFALSEYSKQLADYEAKCDWFRKTELDLLMNRLKEEDKKLNEQLLIPDPKNSIMVLEIKSISEWGFEYRQKEGKSLPEHEKQLMFYMWKLREKYPWIIGRVLYSETAYQSLLEFNVDYKQETIDSLQKVWDLINKCVEDKTPPPSVPDIIKNSRTNRWQLNYQADWCRYHVHCTGDPAWKDKAYKKVEELNKTIAPRRNAR
jgi:hypothetical protein